MGLKELYFGIFQNMMPFFTSLATDRLIDIKSYDHEPLSISTYLVP